MQWIDTQAYFVKSGLNRFVELGPSPILLGMLKNSFKFNRRVASDLELLWVGNEQQRAKLEVLLEGSEQDPSASAEAEEEEEVAASAPAAAAAPVAAAPVAVAAPVAAPVAAKAQVQKKAGEDVEAEEDNLEMNIAPLMFGADDSDDEDSSESD